MQILSADFAPDSGVVAGAATTSAPATADTLTGIGQLAMGTGATGRSRYSADGSALSAVDERGHVVQWDPRPQSWIHRACTIVARDLTPTEWDTYLPGVPLERTCTAS